MPHPPRSRSPPPEGAAVMRTPRSGSPPPEGAAVMRTPRSGAPPKAEAEMSHPPRSRSPSQTGADVMRTPRSRGPPTSKEWPTKPRSPEGPSRAGAAVMRTQQPGPRIPTGTGGMQAPRSGGLPRMEAEGNRTDPRSPPEMMAGENRTPHPRVPQQAKAVGAQTLCSGRALPMEAGQKRCPFRSALRQSNRHWPPWGRPPRSTSPCLPGSVRPGRSASPGSTAPAAELHRAARWNSMLKSRRWPTRPPPAQARQRGPAQQPSPTPEWPDSDPDSSQAPPNWLQSQQRLEGQSSPRAQHLP